MDINWQSIWNFTAFYNEIIPYISIGNYSALLKSEYSSTSVIHVNSIQTIMFFVYTEKIKKMKCIFSFYVRYPIERNGPFVLILRANMELVFEFNYCLKWIINGSLCESTYIYFLWCWYNISCAKTWFSTTL